MNRRAMLLISLLSATIIWSSAAFAAVTFSASPNQCLGSGSNNSCSSIISFQTNTALSSSAVIVFASVDNQSAIPFACAASNLSKSAILTFGHTYKFTAYLASSCSVTSPTGLSAVASVNPSVYNYTNPQAVNLVGYSGPQEDPVISPDGQYLFFDSHNDSGLPQYLFYAQKIDYKTFQFKGPVQGANAIGQVSLRGNYDLAHNFYFVSTLCGSPAKSNFTGICHGIFNKGAVTGLAPVQGLPLPTPPPGYASAVFDLAISPDGTQLYYTMAIVNTSTGFPASSQIVIAGKNPDGSFTRMPNSSVMFSAVNGLSPVVYNSAPTPDGLYFLFTGLNSSNIPTSYLVSRSSAFVPWGQVVPVDALNMVGAPVFSEMGGVSPDGNYVYSHRVLSPSSSQIFVATRNPQVTFVQGGSQINAGSSISVAGSTYTLNMQWDGNLVLYSAPNVARWGSIWETFFSVGSKWGSVTAGMNTLCSSGSGCYMKFQSDGNLVLFYPNGTPYWASGTGGHAGAVLQLNSSQPYLAIYSNGNLLWSTQHQEGSAFFNSLNGQPYLKLNSVTAQFYDGYNISMQGDGNLVLSDRSGNSVWATSWPNETKYNMAGHYTYGMTQCATSGACYMTFKNGNINLIDNSNPSNPIQYWGTQLSPSVTNSNAQLKFNVTAPYVQIMMNGMDVWNSSLQ